MLKQWISFTKAQLKTSDFFHISGKRISRDVKLECMISDLIAPDITLDMIGFQNKKIKMLTDYYLNLESVEVAKAQLKYRQGKDSYGSVGITTYNHFSKKERPMHGPCIQSVVLTNRPGRKTDIDIFYRTTEVFKKFAADLIWLRTILLPNFELYDKGRVRFHFANTTYHPMYWVVSAPYFSDPVKELRETKKTDEMTWKGVIRWTNRYFNDQEGLLKFKQGHRVGKHMHQLVDPAKLKELDKYIAQEYKRLKKPEEIKDDE